jgi:hypothetical protein
MKQSEYLKLQERLVNLELDLKEIELLSKSDTKDEEVVHSDIKTVENLSSDSFKLPLKIKGKMLGVGRFKTKFYTKGELLKSVQKYQGQKFPLKLDHKNMEASSTIGMVDRIFWSENDNAIMYEAHINDETHARNVLDGATTQVSAGILSFGAYDPVYGKIGLDLEYDELSLVQKGQFPGNSVEVAE